MKTLRIVVGSLLLVAASAGSPASDLDYQLVWSDEFDGSGVDPTKWEFQIGDGCPNLCGWGNNELQYYRQQNATVSNGQLVIDAREESFGGRAYTSTRMRTINLAEWTYGRFEMRAQMPTGQGLWPAFWMLPTDDSYGGWAASGEIDIMEYLGHDTDHSTGAIHYGGSWPDNVFWTRGNTIPSGNLDDSMHDYSLEWTPHEIRWFVDDQEFACQSHWSSSGAGYPAPFDDDFHLILNMAVGGNLPGNPDASTMFPQDLIVDHVRVYQRPEFPQCEVLFDGMDHQNPFANGWFTFNGNGSGSVGGHPVDKPPVVGCNSSLTAGFGTGGGPGFVGGFGRNALRDLTDMTHFSFWINPDAGQDYVLEINLQDDDNGDDFFPGNPDGADDEFQYNCAVSATGPCAIAGGGWQKVSIPLADFFDDNSFHFGGNGIFDPFPTGAGGNGQLVNVVISLINNAGSAISLRTDRWLFSNESTSISGIVWGDADGNGALNGAETGWSGIGVDLLDGEGATLESTVTDGSGNYQFDSIPWGEYSVSIQTATLPGGAAPTADPDGIGTPHVTTAVRGCSDTVTAQDFGYSGTPNPTSPKPASLLLATKSGGDLEITYDVSCAASDHTLIYGTFGDFANATAADCSIGSSGSTISTPPSGDVWFLLAGRESERFSSLGQSSAGERAVSGVGAVCPVLTLQDLGGSCP